MGKVTRFISVLNHVKCRISVDKAVFYFFIKKKVKTSPEGHVRLIKR